MKNYVITIARGYGSGGRAIGQMLAKELNIPFYDRELLKLASDASAFMKVFLHKLMRRQKILYFILLLKKFIQAKSFLLIEMILFLTRISLTIKLKL